MIEGLRDELTIYQGPTSFLLSTWISSINSTLRLFLLMAQPSGIHASCLCLGGDRLEWLLEAPSKGQKEPSQELIAKLALQIMSLDLIRYLLLDRLGEGAVG